MKEILLSYRSKFYSTLIGYLILAFTFSHPVNSQNLSLGIPFSTNYSKTEYNASAANWSITQDERGIMYFGNDEGLLEFDGSTWRKYVLPNKTIIRSVSIDPGGNIYVGGQGEFGFFGIGKNGKLVYKSLIDKIPKAYRNFEDVWRVVITPDGVFFNTFRYIFKYSENKIQVLLPENIFGFLLPINNDAWVMDANFGLKHFKEGALNLVEQADNFKTYDVATLMPTNDGNIIIVTYTNGLYKFSEKGIIKWDIPANAFIEQNSPYCGIRLRNGNYAIGTSNNGIVFLNQSGIIIQHLTKGRGLSNRSINYLFEDKTGNLWAGTNNGISYIEIQSPFTKLNEQIGVFGAGYTSFYKNETLYLGTNIGSFYSKIANNNSIDSTKFKPIESGDGQTWNISDIDGTLFLGQHNGTSVIEGHRAYRLSNTLGAWEFTPLLGSPNTVLEGHYKGFSLFEKDISTSKWHFKNAIEGFDESSRIIEQDSTGEIWMAHSYKGIYKINLNQSMNSVIETKLYTAEHGLPSNVFNGIAKIDNEIIFTGETGIYEYDWLEDQFRLHKKWATILDSTKRTKKLIEDKRGNIWYVLDDEVGLLEKQSNEDTYLNKTNSFGKLKGQLVPGFEHINPLMENYVLFGTDDGFILYHPLKENKDKSVDFEAIIRDVSILKSGTDSTFYFGNTPINKDMNSDEVGIEFSSNSLKFSYSSIHYQDVSQLKYKYYLEGFESNWSQWNSTREKEYTNLPEGKYVFHVMAKNLDNIESSVASFPFEVYPPWYRSVYAVASYFVILIMLFFIPYLFTRTKYEKEKDSLLREQEKTLKSKEEEYAEMSKHTEEMLIKLKNEKLETEMLHKNKELAASTLHIIHNNDFLTDVSQKLENVAKRVKVVEAQREINKLVKTIKKDIVHDVDWKKFEIHFDASHENYLARLRDRYPQLTPKDQKLCSFLKMNLATKEIAPLLNISVRGVEIARYRLRKKLEIDSKMDLIDFIMKI